MTSLFWCSIVALTLAGGCAGKAPRPTDDIDREFKEQPLPGQGDGALLLIHDPGFAPANILVVRMPDGTLVLCSSPYDTASTRAMVRRLRDRFSPPRILAINVHFHPDGTGGNTGYRLEAVETYGSDLTAASLSVRGPAVWKETARAAPPLVRTRLEATPIVPAATTFRAADGLHLNIGGEPIDVSYPGPGHSPDNTVVYFPSRRLLYGGDLIRAATAGVGYRGDADLMRWPIAVMAVASLPFDTVVPGHGAPGGRQLIDHTLKVLADARH